MLFCDVAGYEREALIVAPHNIIPSPWVPSAVLAKTCGLISKQVKSWIGVSEEPFGMVIIIG